MGSMLDKTDRLRKLARWIAGRWNAGLLDTVDRAAFLCKTDLLSEMIGSGKEYASLEGVMGAYYAMRHGESPEVVLAIRDHVKPRGAGDELPVSEAGAALAVADRADTVAGCFLAGRVPSGSEDPYGVRRAANGVVRLLLEQGRALDLKELMAAALEGYAQAGHAVPEGLAAQLADFWGARIESLLGERGFAYDEIAAALGGTEGGEDPVDVERRAAALRRWRGNEDFRPLVIGFKRVANILRAAPDAPAQAPARLEDPVEAALAGAVERATTQADPGFAARDYDAVLQTLLGLRGAIDAFFDGVLVNDENPEVRRRRLGILAGTRALFDRGWDLSKVVVEG
jgi:glycyl-tRNA synthetase beta chain